MFKPKLVILLILSPFFWNFTPSYHNISDHEFNRYYIKPVIATFIFHYGEYNFYWNDTNSKIVSFWISSSVQYRNLITKIDCFLKVNENTRPSIYKPYFHTLTKINFKYGESNVSRELSEFELLKIININ